MTWREADNYLRGCKSVPASVLAVTRDPWDRLASWFSFVRRAPMFDNDASDAVTYIRGCHTFHEYVKGRRHFLPPQSFWLRAPDNATEIPITLLRFETIQADWTDFIARLPLENIKLPHLHGAEAKPYRELYDEETSDIVGRFYLEDRLLFEYEHAPY